MIDSTVFEYPLDFIVMTDAHYYSAKLGTDTPSYKKYDATNQKAVKDSPAVISAAFAQIAKSDCENIIFCGDATCDGDYDSHIEFIKLLYALKKCGKRVFAITSTHDYQDDGMTSCYTGEVKTKIPCAKREEMLGMYHSFGPDQAFSQFELSYASELDGNYILLALNSDKNGKGKSGYSEEHRDWIKKIAEAAKKCGKRVIAFTHHPILSPSPMYSLIGKNDMMGEHDEIKDFLADLGISLVFTGHSHVHDISYDFSENGNVLYDISTSALAGYPGYYRTVRICGDNVNISSVKTDEPVNGLETELSEYLENKFLGVCIYFRGKVARKTTSRAICAAFKAQVEKEPPSNFKKNFCSLSKESGICKISPFDRYCARLTSCVSIFSPDSICTVIVRTST